MKLLKLYGRAVAHHPFLVLLIVALLTVCSIHQSSNIQQEATSYEKILPEETDIIEVMFTVADEFGGLSSVLLVIETSPNVPGSNEVRDMRSPEAIRYADLLARRASLMHSVEGASSAADIVMENGHIPNSIEDIKKHSDALSRYISKDYSMSLVRLELSNDFDEAELEQELSQLISEVPRPPGLSVSVSGEAVQIVQMEKLIGPDMQKTSMISLAGILIIVILLFSSIRYGLIPLTTIVFGTMWAFGIMGSLGMALNSQMAGVTSMIMGIGIDFGIQVTTRFRHELKHGTAEKAVEQTIENVSIPMGTATIAALIGFKAMGMGTLTFLGDLGVVMAYGVASSMIAAVTAVPALLVLSERYFGKEGR